MVSPSPLWNPTGAEEEKESCTFLTAVSSHISLSPEFFFFFSPLNFYVEESFVLRGELKSWEEMRFPREREKTRPGHPNLQSVSLCWKPTVCRVYNMFGLEDTVGSRLPLVLPLESLESSREDRYCPVS